MLCEICKQNQATIHVQTIDKGEKITLHVCADCAAEKDLNTAGTDGVNIAEILINFLHLWMGRVKICMMSQRDLVLVLMMALLLI